MARDDAIVDWRSTGRRKARRALYRARIPYSCVDCNVTSTEPPKDAPNFFEEIWPEENRSLTSQLQADHESKDLTNNAVEDLNWRCPSCHKKADQQSEKGQSQSENEVFKLF